MPTAGSVTRCASLLRVEVGMLLVLTAALFLAPTVGAQAVEERGSPPDLPIDPPPTSTSTLSLKVYLGGPYAGGAMSTSLRTSGLVPLSQPYAGAPWSYPGAESVTSVPAPVVDWVLVELRTGTASATKAATRAGFVKSDGTVTDLDGTTPLAFSSLTASAYYVVVRHRNHLAAMSATAVSVSSGSGAYDFTTGQDKAFGANALCELVAGSAYGLCGGDADGNGQVQNSDKNSVWRTQVGQAGYRSGDFDLNGQVQNSDKNSVWRTSVGRAAQVN